MKLSTQFEPTFFSSFYPYLLEYIMLEGTTELNERTGKRVRALPGLSFCLNDLVAGVLPTDGFRRQYPGTAAAEMAWFLSGSSNVTDLHLLGCHIWDKFVTPGTDQVECAYGFRWRNYFGGPENTRDQIALAIETLKKDPSSRQIVVSPWDPEFDGLGAKGLNFPCPVMFTFNAIGGRLHSTMLLRSSDVFVGLPYDVMGHALLVNLMANTVGLKPGTLSFMLAHAHVYDVHWEMALQGLKLLNETPEAHRRRPRVLTTAWTIDNVLSEPQDFVRGYREMGKHLTWPAFAPKPEVVQ